MGSDDDYVQADFYDVLATGFWDALRPAVAEILEPHSGAGGTAVDLGAGTGLSTVAVAQSLPCMDVLASEPNATLRASLMTRILIEGLGARATVLPHDAAVVLREIHEPVDVVTAFNMIGHLSPLEREGFWRWLASRLRRGGVAVVGPVAAHAPSSVSDEETTYAVVPVGRRTYEGLQRAEVLGDGSGRWHMTWRVREGGTLVDERRAVFDWDDLTVEDAIVEIERAGLQVSRETAQSADLLVIHQPSA